MVLLDVPVSAPVVPVRRLPSCLPQPAPALCVPRRRALPAPEAVLGVALPW